MRGRTAVAAACLVLMTALVYLPLASAGFFYLDDDVYLWNNTHVAAGLTLRGLAWAFTAQSYAANWHPLTWLSLMADVQVFGVNPGAAHLVNAAFHAAGAALLFLAWLGMTGSLGRSFFVAGLFAVHPLHVESVAWIAERKDVLAGLCFMMALLAYLRHLRKPSPWRMAGVAGLYALALMAKPTALTLPFVLLLLDFWPLGRWRPSGPSAVRASLPVRVPIGRLLAEKTPLFVICIPMIAVTYLVQRSWGAVETFSSYPAGVRVLNALVSYASYLVKTAWPVNLSVYYPHPGKHLPWWQAGAAFILLACATAACLRGASRRPWAATGWLWYLGMLVPVIGLIQVGPQAMADRYTYLPLIGPSVILAWGAAAVCPRKAATVILVVLALGSWIILSRQQARLWRNSINLLERAWRRTGDPWMALNWGNSLRTEQRRPEAEAVYREIIRQNPSYTYAHYNLGNLLAEQGKGEEAELHYRLALKAKPDYVEAASNLGGLLLSRGDADAAIREYAAALRTRPDSAAIWSNLALALARAGRMDRAEASLRQASFIRPADAEIRNNLGNVLAARGRRPEAVAEYERALSLDPALARAHRNLGNLLSDMGHLREAGVHLAAAVRLEPGNPAGHRSLGRLLELEGKRPEAMEEYRRARQLEATAATTPP